jgi:acetyl-CoA C-acetyltransferase
MSLRKVAIVGSARTPFARSFGAYFGITHQELMDASLKGLVEKYGLKGERLGEVVCGSVLTHSADWNFARECTLGSGLSPETPAITIAQACALSLQASILVANKIALGQIDCGIAGGVETNGDVPLVFSKEFAKKMVLLGRAKSFMEKVSLLASVRPSDLKPVAPAVVEPRTGLSMGESCEAMAKHWSIARADQDQLALASHQNAIAAYKRGFFKDLVVPFHGVDADNNVRESTLEKMAKLPPAFDRTSGQGTLTAANSTPLTDGSAAVLLASEDWAKSRGLPVLAFLTFSETAAVDFVTPMDKGGEGLLMAPAYAVPRMLKRAGLKLQDFDLYEIHEAFAAQVLCTLKAWESQEFCQKRLGLSSALGAIDRKKMNVNGGSVALGHPFGATGARILGALAKELNTRGRGRALVSVCTGGGMGVSAIVER